MLNLGGSGGRKAAYGRTWGKHGFLVKRACTARLLVVRGLARLSQFILCGRMTFTGDTRENGQPPTRGEEPWVTQMIPRDCAGSPNNRHYGHSLKGDNPTVWVKPATARVVRVLGGDWAATNQTYRDSS